MNVIRIIYVFLTILFSIHFLAARSAGNRLNGNYVWRYTMNEKECMLVRKSNSKENVHMNLLFRPNFTFEDSRSATCGNDIFYKKKGRYYFSRSQLILNYTGGTFTDNVGGDTRQLYVLGRVFFKVTKIHRDTIFLTKVKGESERKEIVKK